MHVYCSGFVGRNNFKIGPELTLVKLFLYEINRENLNRTNIVH